MKTVIDYIIQAVPASKQDSQRPDDLVLGRRQLPEEVQQFMAFVLFHLIQPVYNDEDYAISDSLAREIVKESFPNICRMA